MTTAPRHLTVPPESRDDDPTIGTLMTDPHRRDHP